MTIAQLVQQGFHYAFRCRSLWLFGFFVGLATGGSNGGSGGSGDHGSAAGALGAAGAAATALPFLPGPGFRILVGLLLAAIVVGFVLKFVGEGALIEGVARIRRGATMTTRDGFRAGWAHWGVIVRIALLYFAATVASLLVLAAPGVVAWWLFGAIGAVLLAVPAVIVAVPWLVTLSLVQEFAWRIAVLENRRAIDAIAKARLFLHGRLIHGLKLIVASFIGTVGIGLLSAATILPVMLGGMVLVPILGVVPAIGLCAVVLLPLIGVLTAMLGTFRSSVWTLGYVTQVES